VSRTAHQSRLTRPRIVVRGNDLSRDQRYVLILARVNGSITTQEVRLLGYHQPSAALCRLARRGLLRRLKRGVYYPVAVAERIESAR
jgi:predicted transcriptional regulator of viral defense system